MPFFSQKIRGVLQGRPRLRLNQSTLILILTIFFLLIFGFAAYCIPHTIPIEGNIVVDQLGFLTAQDQPFLDGVKIDEIKISGKKTYAFDGDFEGYFESKEIPQLKKQSKLVVTLQDESSSITITPVAEKNILRIFQLDLLASIEVSQLMYEPPLLSFSLSPLDTSKNSDSGVLTIKSIEVPTKIIVEGNHKITGTRQERSKTIVIAQPLSEYKTSLPARVQIWIKLHGSEQNIFFGNHAVSQVDFSKRERTLDYKDYSYSRSAIRSGTLRIANQTITVEKNQFIKLGSKKDLQDIKKLPYIRLVHDEAKSLQIADQKISLAEPTYGLEVGISGQTNRLEVGINQSLPIKIIRSTLLSELPPETVNVLLIIFTSVFSSLVTFLFSNIPQKPQSRQP